jgi:hypothetical protein
MKQLRSKAEVSPNGSVVVNSGIDTEKFKPDLTQTGMRTTLLTSQGKKNSLLLWTHGA